MKLTNITILKMCRNIITEPQDLYNKVRDAEIQAHDIAIRKTVAMGKRHNKRVYNRIFCQEVKKIINK